MCNSVEWLWKGRIWQVSCYCPSPERYISLVYLPRGDGSQKGGRSRSEEVKERERESTFLPGGTRFWFVLRMCVRAFLMFFSFMLDSTAGGRKRAKPHSFL